MLTLFIGGNHEASNYLQELPYGGWVAPNIFYMGYASVVRINGLRIAGLSGIYKSNDLLRGHFESPPYTDSTLRSVYHTRNLEIFRLKQLTGNIDVFLSHDWPAGVTKFGDEESLLRQKPFFHDDIQTNSLGSPPCMELLNIHHPKYWFSAHLHCKFAAVIPNDDKTRLTKFLALDKCLPKRKFLQIVELDGDGTDEIKFEYDLEWLTILNLTNHLLSVKNSVHYMPGPGGAGRWDFKPTEAEKKSVLSKLDGSLEIPESFIRTAAPFSTESPQTKSSLTLTINKQTTEFCDKLGIDDPSALLIILKGGKIEEQDTYHDSLLERSVIDEDFVGESDVSTINNKSMDNLTCDTSFKCDSPPIISSPIEEKKEETVVATIQAEPNTKKFKRRNLSMYSDDLEINNDK